MMRIWVIALAIVSALCIPARAEAPPVSPMNQVYSQAAITPTDNTLLSGGATQAIYNGSASACNLAFIAVNDTAPQTWQNVPTGIVPVRAKVVMATNTTCTNLIALYW